MALPSELIELILSFISYDEATQSSLSSFALVCRAWAPLVESQLYRHIIVHRKHQWRKLRKALRARPHLRGLTRSLQFTNVHIELGPKFHPFGHLFPVLGELSFCGNSVSTSIIRELCRGAPETLRHVALVGTYSTWQAIADFFREDRTPWDSIKIEAPLYWPKMLEWGSISVRRLELLESWHSERYGADTLHELQTLTFLCLTSFPNVTELVLCYRPLSSNVFHGTDLLGVRLPKELNDRLRHVRVELRGWQQVEDTEIFNQIFGQVASRGGLTINTELAP